MTDGLIQKLFEKYKSKKQEVVIPFAGGFLLNMKYVKQLEQELIEEIKKTCSNSDEIGCFCSRLIGDNE